VNKERIVITIIIAFFLLSLIMGIYLIMDRIAGRRFFAKKEAGGIFKPKYGIALVRIYGALYMPRKVSGWGNKRGTDRIIEELNRIKKDPLVKAVVLHINSPGGSVACVQEIYEEVLKLKSAGKKVVVSMGDVCASGGYYIACCGDKIFANPGTITGSIGVIMSLGNFQGLLKKAGVEMEVVKSGRYKDMGSFSRTVSPEERKIFQGIIDDVYDYFLKVVIKERKLSAGVVNRISEGQIFSGGQAKELGLVDELGNLKDAIKSAGGMAGIKGEPKIIEHIAPFEFFFDVLSRGFIPPLFSDSLEKKMGFRLDYMMEY